MKSIRERKNFLISTQFESAKSSNKGEKKKRKSMKKGACDLQRCCTNSVRSLIQRDLSTPSFRGVWSLCCEVDGCEALREKSRVGVVWKEL